MRKIKIFKVAHRHNLLIGADRILVLGSSGLIAIVCCASSNLLLCVFGLFLWFFILSIFRKMAKNDPQLREIYQRHITYKTYYPPRSTPFRINSNSRKISAFSKNYRKHK